MKYSMLIALLLCSLCGFLGCNFPKDVPWQESWSGKIYNFSPGVVSTGGQIRVEGSIFGDKMPEDFEITVNGVRAFEEIYTGKDFTYFKVPAEATTGYIKCKLHGKEFQTTSKLYIWKKIPWMQNESRSNVASFTIDNVAYVGMGTGKSDFWRFNADNNTWASIASPTNVISTSYVSYKGFSIGQKGYVIGNGSDGANALWEYTPNTNTWLKKNSFTNSYRDRHIATSANGKAYAGGGVSGTAWDAPAFKDWWEYNPVTNIWTKKADIPSIYARFAIGLGDKVYVVTSQSIWWEYNTITNSWTEKGYLPSEPLSFTTKDNKIYLAGFRSGYGYDIMEYDTNTNSWKAFITYPGTYYAEQIFFSVSNAFIYGYTSNPYETFVRMNL